MPFSAQGHFIGSSQMFRYCTGLPWSCSRIGPGVRGSPPSPAVVLSLVIFTSSWILTPLWRTVIRPGSVFFPSCELRGVELDVVALPDGRGLAGVHQRLGDAVDAAAVVVLAVQAVAVEHLHLVPALDVDAAVAAALAARLRHVRHAELDVQLERARRTSPW